MTVHEASRSSQTAGAPTWRARAAEHAPGRGTHGADQARDSRAHDPGLLGGDGAQPRAEQLDVLALDPRDHRERRVDRVHRVEAPAEPDLEHRGARAPLRKVLERRQRQPLEVRQPGPRPQAPAQVPDDLPERLPGDLRAAQPDALADAHQVRRGVQTGRVAGGQQHRLEKRRGRALALGPGDDHRGERALRVPEPGERAPHRPETELPPEAHLALQERFRVDKAHGRILRRV